MSSKLKRFLSLLLAFTMVLSIVPVSAEGSDGTVTETDTPEYVAQIESKGGYYTTLQAAFEAAQDGDTIKLLGDVVDEGPVKLSVSDTEVKTITLDLNGKTWDCGYGTRINAVELLVKNGTIGSDRRADGFDGKVDVFHFGGHAKLPSTMVVENVTLYAELHVNNMAPSDEELGLLQSTSRSTSRAFNATEVILESKQYDVVTVQKGAYLTVNGGIFKGGINEEEGAFVTDTRKGETTDSGETVDIGGAKLVTIMAREEYGYTRTERGVTITFVDPTPVAIPSDMEFTVGANYTTINVQKLVNGEWETVTPGDTSTSTYQHTFKEYGSVTFRVDWDGNGTYDRLVVLVKGDIREVDTKEELKNAIATANDGTVIKLTADIDYGTDHLEITKSIILDLGGHTLTTRAVNYGLALKNEGIIVTNGKLNHAGTVAAIKVWSADEISNLEIDVTGTSSRGNTINGIVIQKDANGVRTLKNVKIHSTSGQGVSVGIETYECGNANTLVIGNMENVTIDAKDKGMLISAPCGTATNCDIKGGVSGIEICLKGTYSAWLQLVNSKVYGGEQAVYAHDEFNSNPDIVNNGTLKLVADSATKFATSANGELLKTSFARIEDTQVILPDLDTVAENTTTGKKYSDLHDALTECEAGETVILLQDVDLKNVKWAPVGKDDAFEGIFDGGNHTISNLYQSGWDFGYEWGSYGALGLFAKINDATIKNLTIAGAECLVEGGDVGGITGSATGTCVFENITITDSTFATYNNGCGGIIAWSGPGNYTFKNITIDSSVTLAGLWGSFDSSIGGIVGQAKPGATYTFENVDIACRIDAYNDCTASYDYYNYRMCGMIMGRLEETTTIDGRNVPDTSKYNITCTDVVVSYGPWSNYHYCDPTPGYNNGRGMRVEAGYAYDGLPADYDHTNCTTHCKASIPFDQLFGGEQYGVKGLPNYDGVTVIYGHVAQIGENGYWTLADAITVANANVDAEGVAVPTTVTLLKDVTVSEKLTITGDVTIVGEHTITRADTYTGTLFAVNAGAALTLDGGLTIDGGNAWTYTKTPPEMDMANGAGTTVTDHITPAEGGVNATANMIENKGTLNVHSVTIQNSYSTNKVHIINAGANSKTTINGATIKNTAANASGAVAYINGNDAVLTIKGDTRITGNFGIGNGGIIQNYGQGTTVNLEGGSIDNNHVGKSGTLYASYSGNASKINTFNMSGGIITNNIMEGYGPVYIHTNTVWNMTGGEISNNTSFLPNYVRNNNPAGTMSGGRIVDNVITGLDYSDGYYVTHPDLRLNGKTGITGGTYTQDVTEYLAPNYGLETVVREDGVTEYTVTDEIAEVNGVTYHSVAEAVKAANAGDTITVLVNHKVDATTVVDKNVTIDLNGKTITTASTAAGDYVDAFTILADVIITGAGKINARPSHGYTFYVGDKSGNAGNLTIKNGTFYGETSVVNNRLGTVTIEGGNFAISLENEGDDYRYLLNCIDANYNSGAAKINVMGGTFYKFDPSNNAAEGEGTSFLADGYISEELTENYFTVRVANYVAQVGDVKYEDLKEALEACTAGETVMLIADIVYEADDVVYAHGGGTGFGKYDAYNPSIVYIGGTKGETEAENQPSNVNAVINLNGHSITNNASAYLFLIMDNAKVTFTGNGSVINNSGSHPAIWAVGAETLVTITSGNYVTNSPYGVVHVTHSADMTITGGSFSTTADDASLLVVLNSQNYNNPNYFLSGVATISISGGSFKGFNPELVGDDYGASTIEEIKFFNGCATGYEAVLNEENGWYTVQLWDYEIWNKEDLYFFAELANDGFKFEKTVQLMDDVDLEAETWTPIAKFVGVFAGNDHTISNFNIDATAGHGGFFNELYWATVKDLTLADVTATVGDYRFGTLARSVNQTNIDNVTVSNVEVTTAGSSAFVAGLFCHGTVNSNMEVNNCTVEDLTVNAQNGAMLIAGITTFVQKNGTEAEGTNILENLHVKNFKVVVNDTDGYAAVGGLVGQTQTVWQNPRFNNCSVTGLDVTASGNVDVGGFICYPGSWTYAENCSAAGKINVAGVTSASNYAGGFFGNYGWGDNVSKGDHKVTNCTANVEIITKIATAGGFVGSGTNSEGRNKNITLTNCKALGTVTCVEGGTAIIGGFAGLTDRGIYTNCTAAQEPFIGYVADENLANLVNNNSYVARVGDSLYATFDGALAAAKASEDKTVEILAPVVLTTDKEYDLADVTVTNKGDVYPLFRIQNGANVTITGGTITNNDYVFVLGASDGSSAGYLTISGGTYTGDTTMASVTKGTLTVTGGEFKVTDSGYGTGYLLNCIDANYTAGSAKINVMGGTFYMFDPSNNAAEGEGTSFLADGYISEELKENYWTVRQSKDALDPIVTITFTDSNSGETVTLKYPSERYDTIQKLIGTNDYADFVLGAEQSELLAYVADGTASNIVMTLHDDVALDAPINFYNKYFQVPVEYAITLDGNGHTITWADGYTGTLLNVESGVSLTTKNLTIDGENAFTFYNDTTTVENGQNWYTRFVDVGEEDKAINANVIVNAGNLTLGEDTKIQNVTIASNGANGKTENTETGYVLKYNDDLAVIKSNGGTVNMNGATITGNAGMILNAVNASTSINATISGNMGAGDKGGIIIVNGGTANIAGSITGNKAMARSATILGVINGAEVTFTGTMENNKQIGVGGNTAGAMVVLEGASQFVMNGGSISDNVGGRAGAIASRWATADALIELITGEIKGNTADEKYGWNGASIFLRSPATIGGGMTVEGPIVVNAAPGELEITGGSFTGSLAVTDGLTAAISGGTFNYDPSEWVVEGMVAVKQDEDTWTVDDLLAEIVFQAFGGAETRITYPGYADSLQGLVDYYMLCNNANETALPGFSAGDYTPVLNIYGQLNESAVFGGASTDGAYVSAEPMTWTINTNGEFDPANIETAPGYVLTMVDEDTYTVTFDYVCWVQSELLAGNDVTLDRDIVVDGTYIESIPASTNGYGKYPNYGIFNVVGENVTFDLNGHNITYNGHATFTWNGKTVNSCTVAHGLFFANDGANLNICGDGVVTVYGLASAVYSVSPDTLIDVTGGTWKNEPCKTCGGTNIFVYAQQGGEILIEGGYFDQALDANGDSYLIVEHGGSPKNEVIDYSKTKVTVTGGTFKGMNPENAVYINQTGWNSNTFGEKNVVAKGYKAFDNGNGTWTVKPNQIFEMHLADANGEAHWLSPMKSNDLNELIEISKIWYESLQGTYSFTLKVLESYETDETVLATFPMTIDLCGNTLSASKSVESSPVIRVLSDVTVKNGTVDGTSGINSYAFIVGNSETAGALTIADGTYKGVTSAVSVTNGVANITGGSFMTGHDGEGTDYGAQYLLNCVDSAYTNGTAKYNITGGTFYGFNPEDNAAEGAGTNYLKAPYIGMETEEGSGNYTVVDYIEWIKAELLAGNDVTLERDIVVDGTYIDSIPAATNGNGRYPNYGIFNVVGEDVTFDLNGHNITYNGHANFTWNGKTVNSCTVAHGLFFANAGANLEICDSVGDSLVTVNGLASGVYAASPNTAINVTGGSWVNHGCADCGGMNLFLYASHGGEIVISAGNFTQDLDAAGDSYLIVNHNGEYKNSVIDFAQSDITIFGGTFTGMNPEEAHFFRQTADNKLVMGEAYNAVADNYIAKKVDGKENTWIVVEGKWVAQVGETKYATLAEAVQAAQGTTDPVVVLVDFAENTKLLDQSIAIPVIDDLIVDLDGHTVDFNGFFIVNGTVEIKDGTLNGVSNGWSTVQTWTAESSSDLRIAALLEEYGDYVGTVQLTLSDVDVTGARHALRAEGGNVTINGGSFTANASGSTNYAINVGGDADSTVVINDTVVKGESNQGGNAIIVKSGSNLTIYDGNYSSNQTTVAVVSGTMVLYGGTYTENVQQYCAEGYVAVDNEDGTWTVKPLITVIFDNVTMVEGNELPEFTWTSNFTEVAEDGTMLVVGEPEVTLEEGKTEYEITAEAYVFMNDDYAIEVIPGTLTVLEAIASVTVGETTTYYADLKEAIEACTNGETVKLLKDITYGSDDVVYAHGGATGFGNYDQYNPSIIYIGGTRVDGVNSPSNVNAVIDLNDHKITNDANAYLFLIMDNARITFAGEGIVETTTAYPVIWSTGTDTVVRITSGEYITASANGLLHATHSGDLVITGGEFKTTAENASLLIVRNEQDRKNSAYFISGKSTVTVTGGTFYGFNPEKMFDDSTTPFTEFNAVVDGYIARETPENVWEVVRGEWIAQIIDADGNVTGKYETLAEAIAAVQNGETIELLTDVTVDADLGILVVGADQDFTIDLNEYDLTLVAAGSGNRRAAFTIFGTLKIAGNGDIQVKKSMIAGVGFYVEESGTLILNGSGSNTAKSSCYIASVYGNMEIDSGVYSTEDSKNPIFNVPNTASGSAVVTGGTFKNAAFNDTANDGSIAISGGCFVNAVPENWCAEGYIPAECPETCPNEGTYTVKVGEYVAQIGDVKYETLAAAIAAVQNGETIVLLAETLDEDVTIKQESGLSFTIDGDNKTYTGTITIDGSKRSTGAETLTIQNVNFVADTYGQHSITTVKSSLVHNVTVDNCTFNATGNAVEATYGIYLRHAYNIKVTNVTGENLFDLVYGNTAVTGFTAENVNVANSTNGIVLAYVNSTATFKNVTTDVTDDGVIIRNNAKGTVIFEECSIDNVTYWKANDTVALTMTFNDASNNLEISDTGSEMLTIVLNNESVTVTAPEGLNATTPVEGKTVIYEEGMYKVVELKYVAQIDETKYTSLQAAINAAVDNDEIILLENLNVADEKIQTLGGQYNTLYTVAGKTVTINLNGKTISGAYAGDSMLVGVFSTEDGGHLTLTGNGTVDVTATGTVYSLLVAYDATSSLTIENGTYTLDKASDNLVYTGGDENVTVNGGTFTLGNVGTGPNGNGSPWIFNAKGQNTANVIVNGGTYNAEINHQYYPFEVAMPATKALRNNNDGTWTVVDAVAYVNEYEKSGNWYLNEMGYATLAEAVASAHKYVANAAAAGVVSTITLLADSDVNFDVTSNIGLELNGKAYTGSVTLKNVDATLKAVEGLNVTTDQEGYVAEYDAVNGLYKVVLGREIVNRGMSLLLTEQVYVKQYISFVGFDLTKEEIIANGGVKVTALDKNGNEYTYNLTLKDAGVLDGYQEFSVATEGIPVAQLGDTLTFRPYVMVDGEEIYTEWQDSARMYSERKFESAKTSESLKSVLAALMNYGAEAQKYFNYRTSDLMNANLQTYVDLGYLDAEYLQLNWSDSYLTAVIEPTDDMTLNFQATDTLVADGTSLNLRGALYLTYYYDGVAENMDVFANATDKTFYIWTADKYNALATAGTPLTKDNASYTVSATYDANAGEFAAKSQVFYSTMYGDAIYTALCVTDANGTEYCSGVSVDSPENYAARKINDGVSAEIDNVVKWMVVYGERAKIHFNK